jgi:hypothetical protein
MPSTRTVLLIVVVLAVVAWRLDAAHRDACIRTGRVDCSWLPWTQSSGPGASQAPAVGGAASGAGSPVPGANGAASGVGGSVSGKLGSGAAQVP